MKKISKTFTFAVIFLLIINIIISAQNNTNTIQEEKEITENTEYQSNENNEILIDLDELNNYDENNLELEQDKEDISQENLTDLEESDALPREEKEQHEDILEKDINESNLKQ